MRADSRARAVRGVRARVSWAATLGLTLIWVVLWGEWTIGAAVFGVVIALGVQLAMPLPDVPELERLRPLALLRVIGWTLWGLVRASVTLSWQILDVRRPVQHAIVRVPLTSPSPFVRAMTAEVTTLIPGSVVIEIDADSMLLHVFDARQAAIDYARFEARVTEDLLVRAFASKAQIAAHRDRVRAAKEDA